MGALRQKMTEGLQRRGRQPTTIETYVASVAVRVCPRCGQSTVVRRPLTVLAAPDFTDTS